MSENNKSGSAAESEIAEKYAHKLIRTLRVRLADEPGMLGKAATAVGEFGGLIGEVTRTAIDSHSLVRDLTVYADDLAHLARIVARLQQLEGV